MIDDLKPPLDEALLIHFGVKGMKWGVVNQELAHPRKAIQEHRATARAGRVAKYQNRADMFNTKISELQFKNEALQGSKNPLNIIRRSQNKAGIKNFSQERDKALKDVEATQKGKLTSKQKKVISGGIAVAALLAAAAVYQGNQSGAINSMQLRGAAFLRGEKEVFKTDASLTHKMGPEDLLKKVAAPVNPGYSKTGGKMNCRRSTFAYELRRRGYDVSATTSMQGLGQSESGFINAVTPGGRNFYNNLSVTGSIQRSEAAFRKSMGENVGLRVSTVARGDKRSNPIEKTILNGLKIGRAYTEEDFVAGKGITESSSRAVLHALERQPEGARGEVLFNFGTFGHSMAYEVVQGKAHIFDSQKGTLYNAAKLVEGKWDGFHSAEITRLDNVKLDLNFLSRWATNAGGSQ